MGKRSKFTYEIKLKLVHEYINGERTALEISTILGISVTSFREWLRKYSLNGAESLKTTSKNTSYSQELKFSAVRDYMSGNGSIIFLK